MILIGATLVQSTISPFIKINGVHPDLVLVLVIGWVTLQGWQEGIIWGLIGGLSLDFISAAPFGIFSLAILLVTLLTASAHQLNLGSSIVLPLC